MAGRPMGRRHQDDIRAKIQAGQLVKRLLDHALGEVEMTTTQIQAARILLDKSVPNLQSVEVGNHEGETFKTENRWIVDVVRPTPEPAGKA